MAGVSLGELSAAARPGTEVAQEGDGEVMAGGAVEGQEVVRGGGRAQTAMAPDPRTLPTPASSERAAQCRLLLVRHAKAVPKSRPVDDFDRPLSQRGRADAPPTGRRLADSGLTCDLVLCSPARRTRQTWRLAVPAPEEPPPVVYDERLYNAPPSMLVEVLAERGRGLSSLALVGHNPGIHQLAAGLYGTGPRDLLKRVRAGFPTARVWSWWTCPAAGRRCPRAAGRSRPSGRLPADRGGRFLRLPDGTGGQRSRHA